MNEFGDDGTVAAVESTKGQLYKHCPLEFVLQVLEVRFLGGSIAKVGLQATDDDVSLYAKVWISSLGSGVLI